MQRFFRRNARVHQYDGPKILKGLRFLKQGFMFRLKMDQTIWWILLVVLPPSAVILLMIYCEIAIIFFGEIRQQSHVFGLRRAIRRNQDIHALDEALRKFAYDKNWRFVHILLEAGADPTTKDRWSWRPLFYRVFDAGDLPTIRAFIDRGCDVDIRDDYDNTLILKAARDDDIPKIDLLIQLGARIDQVDRFDTTLLFAAVSRGHVRAVTRLIEHGADVNAPNYQWGWTCLREACRMAAEEEHYMTMARLLVRHGAKTKDVKGRVDSAMWEALMQEKMAYFMRAAWRRRRVSVWRRLAAKRTIRRWIVHVNANPEYAYCRRRLLREIAVMK